MADATSRIDILVDTAQAMANLRALERQITSLNRSLIVGSKQNAQFQKQFATSLMHNVNATGRFTASMTTMQTATEQFSSRLDRGKLSLREYYRYGMASTKTFGRMFGREYETLGKVVQKRVKTLQTQYVQLGRNAQGAMQAMQFVPKRLNYDDLNTRLMMSIQRQQMFNKLLSDGSTRLLNFGKNTQWAGRQLMVGFTIPLVMLGAQAIRTFKEIEEQTIRFKKVYGDAFTNEKETKEALNNVRDLAREYTKYGLKIQDTMRMAADAAQQGQVGAALISQVREANKLAILGGVEQEQALETTISLTNAFGIAAEDLAGKINFLNAVENQTILSLEDITKAAPIAGNVVKQLGGDVEDLAFLLTAMREGGINANQGANALKSGLARIINPTNSAVKKLGEFGIDILGIVEANTGDVTGTLMQLSLALNALGNTDRARAIETIFGKYQFTRISTLLQNITKEGSQASRTLEVAKMEAEELAILSEREMKVQADSPMNRLASAIERLKEQLAPIGEIFAKALIPVAEFFTKMFEKFNNLPEGVKKAIAIVIGAIGTIGPVLLMTVGLVANGIANMLKLFAMLRKGYQQLAYGSTDTALKTQYLTQEELENISVSNTLYSSHQQLSAAYRLETASLNALTGAYQRANTAMFNAARRQPGMFTPGAVPRAKAQGFNSGTLSVPGTGNKDTVPAILTPGEAVVPKKQSKKYRGLLRSIIADRVPGFRLGGFIGQTASRIFGGVFGKRPGIVQSGMGAGNITKIRPQNYYAAENLGNGKVRITIPSGAKDGQQVSIVVKQQDQKIIDDILERSISVTPGLKNIGKISRGKENIPHEYSAGGNLYYNLKRKGFNNKELSALEIQEIGRRTFGYTRTKVNPVGEGSRNTPSFVQSRRKMLLRNTPQGKAIINNSLKEFDMLRKSHTDDEIRTFYKLSKNTNLDTYRGNIATGEAGFATSHLTSLKSVGRASNRGDALSWLPSKTIIDNSGLNTLYRDMPHITSAQKAKSYMQENRSKGGKHSVARTLLNYRERSGFYSNPNLMMSEIDIMRANRNNPEFQKAIAATGKDLSKFIRGYNLGTLAAGLSSQRINTLTAKWPQDAYKKSHPNLSNTDPLHGPLFIGRYMKPREDIRAGGALQGSNIRYQAPGRSTITSAFLTGNKKDRAKYLLEQYMRGDYQALRAPGASAILSSISKRRSGTFFRGINLSGNSSIARNMSPLPQSLLRQLQEAERTGDFSKIVGKTFSMRRSSWSEDAGISSGFGSFTIKANIKDKSVIPASEMFPGIKFAKPGSKDAVSEKESLFGGRFKVVRADKSGMEIQGYNQGVFSVPGPNVNKDVVPAMLTPGEAVIPRDQAKKYRPLISSIIADRVPGFNQGTDGLSKAARGRITNAVQEQQRLLRQQNKYTEQQIQDSLKRFKKQKIQEELAAANARRKADLDRQTIKNQEAKAAQDKADKKNARQERRMRFSQRVSGPGMGLAFAVPMIAGAVAAKNPEGAIAQNMMPIMLASMIPMLLPLFTNIPMIIAAAVTAVVGGIWLYNKKQNDAIREQARLVDEISATTEKMKKVGEMTGKVGASEIMARRREGNTGDFTFTERKGITFGSTFFQSEIGKEELETFQERFELMPDRAMREFALRLASYVSDGVLETSQAAEIANQIGVELGNQQVAVEINGKLRELLTFDGKDITKEPFEIRLQIARETIGQLAEFTNTGPASQRLEQIDKELIELREGYAPTQALSLSDEAKRNELMKEREAIVGQINAQTAQAGALAAQGFEAIRAQIDAIEVSSDKEIEKLETLKKQTKDLEKQQKIQEQIDRIERNRASTINKLENANEQVLRSLNTAYDLAKENKDLDTFFTGLNEAVINKFAGTGQEVSAKQFNAMAAKLKDTQVRATIQTQVASGLLNPLQASGLLTAFVNDNEELNKVLNLFIKGSGMENLNRLQSIVGTFEDKQLSKDILIKFGSMDSKEFETAYSTLELLNNMNMEELNLEEFLRIDNGKAFDDLAITLQKIEDIPDKITKEAVVELFTQQNGINLGAGRQGAAKDFIADWEYLDSLPENIRKTAVQTYLSIFSTMFTSKEAREQFAREQAGAEARQETRNLDQIEKRAKVITTTYVNSAGDFTAKGFKKAAQDAAKYTEDIIGEFLAMGDQTDKTKKKIEGGKLEPSWLDDLLKKLRDVRDNTIKITKGFDASMKALKKILSGGKDIKIFSGIEQDLTKLNLSDNFISLITGMDPEEYEKRKKDLFKFDNKGNIKALKEDAKVIEKALLEIALGDFQSKQLGLIKNTQNQTKAIGRLVAAGINAADAFRAVEDATFAAAVANENLTDEELKKIVDTLKKANQELKLFASLQNIAQSNAEFDLFRNTAKAIEVAKSAFGELPDSVIQAIIESADLRNILLSPTFDPAQIQEALQNAADRAQIEIDIKMQTVEGMQELFDEGYSKAMEWFDAQETKIDLEFQFKTLDDRNIIDDAQDRIAALEYQIDDLQAELVEIEDKEKTINETYDKRLEALDKVEKANQSILDQQKSQLDIADALSQGDIAAAAKAAQEMRERQANNQLEQQRDAIEAAREIELAQVRNVLGRTRKQIEEDIKNLQKQIFDIEEQTLEPAKERVRLAEVEKREATEKLTLLGKTRLEWEAIKNRIDIARTSSEQYMESIRRALSLVEDLVRKWGEIQSKTVVLTIIEKRITEGGTTETAPPGATPEDNTVIDEYKARLEEVQREIDRLKAKIAAGGMGPKALENAKNNLAALQEEKRYLLSVINAPTGGGGGGDNSMVFMAKGGLVPQPNGTDVTPAMLTPGEFVISRDAVKAFGLSRLQQINEGTFQDLTINLDKIQTSKRLMKELGDNLIYIFTTLITLMKQIVQLLNDMITRFNQVLNILRQINEGILLLNIRLKETKSAIDKAIESGLTFEEILERVKDLTSGIVDDWNSLQDKKIVLEIERVCTGAEDCGCGGHSGGTPGPGGSTTPETPPGDNGPGGSGPQGPEFDKPASGNSSGGTIVDAYIDAMQYLDDSFRGVGPSGYEYNPTATEMLIAKNANQDAALALRAAEKAAAKAAADGAVARQKNATQIANVVQKEAAAAARGGSQPVSAAARAAAEAALKAEEEERKRLQAQANKNAGMYRQAQSYAKKKYMGGVIKRFADGGLVPYMRKGGLFTPRGTDVVPAMLTPGEFVVRKYAVKDFGLDRLKAINDGTYNDSSVYNYNLSVHVKSEADPNEIAQTVMAQIKRVDGLRLRGNRF